eukprot:3916494-Pleurochrysis_carterae.AAC.1
MLERVYSIQSQLLRLWLCKFTSCCAVRTKVQLDCSHNAVWGRFTLSLRRYITPSESRTPVTAR